MLADEQFLTLRTGNGHVRLVDAEVRFAAPGMEGLMTRLAYQRLFAKAAFDHGRSPLLPNPDGAVKPQTQPYEPI
jgi:hypothetical protein